MPRAILSITFLMLCGGLEAQSVAGGMKGSQVVVSSDGIWGCRHFDSAK